MNKWKRILQILLVAAIAAALVFPTMADDISEAKQKQQELEQQLEDSENRLAELKKNVSETEQDIAQIDAQIGEVESVISDYEFQKTDLEAKITELQGEIDEKQSQIEYEYSLMKKRIKFLYENVGNSVIEAFLTSETFADALNKVQYLIELSDYDRQQMEALEKLQKGIRADKEQMEAQRGEVDVLIGAQTNQQAVLEDMLAVKSQALGTALDEVSNIEAQNAGITQMVEEQRGVVDALVEEYNRKLAEEAAARAAAEAAARAAAEAAARAAAEEAARIAAEEAARAAAEAGNEEEVEPYVPPVVEDPVVEEETPAPGGYYDNIGSSNGFYWPLPGYTNISSWFGYRTDPFGGGFTAYHGGIDIPAPCNTPIHAVQDGIVYMSSDGYNYGCGNYTVIYHGNGLYTEYMHQNSRIVSQGQEVKQGEVIGYVGTTGDSTGYHLHIGVVVSDHGFDTSCRVDPAPYLGL